MTEPLKPAHVTRFANAIKGLCPVSTESVDELVASHELLRARCAMLESTLRALVEVTEGASEDPEPQPQPPEPFEGVKAMGGTINEWWESYAKDLPTAVNPTQRRTLRTVFYMGLLVMLGNVKLLSFKYATRVGAAELISDQMQAWEDQLAAFQRAIEAGKV